MIYRGLERIVLKRLSPNAMKTQVIHTTKKGKSLLSFHPLFWTILYDHYIPIQTLVTTLLLKAGVHVKASANISLTFPTLNLYAYNYNPCLAVLCKFLGDFWVFWERDIFFSKGRLNWGKCELLKIWWIWKFETWSEELVDEYQTAVP